MEKTTYKYYIEDINKYPLLTAEQEKALSERIQSGDTQAKQLLINSNLRFVVQIAGTFSHNEDTLMDAIQEGTIGLMHAATKYDYKFNTRFSTYSHYWIYEYIARYRRNSDKNIKIPFKVQETMRLIASARALLFEKLERNPTMCELSVYTGMSEEEIREFSQFNYTVKSYDAYCERDEKSDFSMLEVLSDDRMNPETELLTHLEKESFITMINMLKEREKIVIQQRYKGFKLGKKTTYKSISALIGTSIEGTRQIEIRANNKMQAMFKNYY